MSNRKKILLIQTAFLGDVVMTTPLIRALHAIFPDDEIDIVTIPQSANLFEHDPAIHKVHLFNKGKFIQKIFSFVSLARTLKRSGYDIGISIQSSLTSSFLMLLARIPKRAGFARQKFLTIPVSHKKGMHMRDRYLTLAQPFSSESFNRETSLHISESEKKRALNILNSAAQRHAKRIGIAPGSVWPTKRWPEAYFIELVSTLDKNGYQLYFIGGGNERELCQRIIERSNARALNLAGELSILESAALINELDIVITNDSAPLHIANAMKTDVVAIFGPTVRRFGCYPYRDHDIMMEIDLYCRPCAKHGGRSCPEKHFRCMLDIKPEAVYEAIVHRLSKGSESKGAEKKSVTNGD
ncbi:MAG: lipopolysaccharide heptosyltransferase II [candidate division KSB1 bacterium]|jgi:heptosyltransferase-2|nr:lipopolysaccharide heptosyltransferase II [candidate division KSB1 bacterium]